MDGPLHVEARSAAAPDDTRAATQDELRAWVEATTGGVVVHWQSMSGGNRCWSWAVGVESPDGAVARLYLRYQPPRPPSAEPYTVWREARHYQALTGSRVPAPALVAIHPDHQAILTARVPGKVEYRRLTSEDDRRTIAREFVEALGVLHTLELNARTLPGFNPERSIADCVRDELAIWRAMYEEVATRDPLIDLALDWLDANVPAPSGSPVLVHGDAGPGNFMFEAGHLTALLDWEFAHPGDPMEDFGWFSMRAVMEPVPDFAGLLAHYGRTSGIPVDLDRIRYHRVFVSTRVVIIRHRNVTGQPGTSLVSRALNRRLLVTALAEANRIRLATPPRLDAPPTDRTSLFDTTIHDLRHAIAEVASEPAVVAAAKTTAKVVKYLRELDRYGALATEMDLAGLTAALGSRPDTVEAGKAALRDAVRAGRIAFPTALQCFAGCAARETQLAAASSGGLATRTFPALEPTQADHG